MNEYLLIGLKTLLFLAIILVIIRIMGKRELGELNVFDIIISFMISEIFSNAIAEPSSNVFLALFPILLIFLVQICISFIVLKSKKIRNIIESKPSLIIDNGVINYKEMKKQRYNISDLLQQIREQGIIDLNEIDFAILESNGNLSVIDKKRSNLLYPFPIVCDGKIDIEYIKEININENNIKERIDKLGYTIEEIFILFIDKNNEFLIFSKEKENVGKHENYKCR